MTLPKVVLLMGPSGCGKSTVGPLLSRKIGGIYLEGDDFHPPANKAKMGSGTPLTDEDRWPWFEILREAVRDALAEAPERPVVLGCSALRRSYRRFLLRGWEDASRLVFLTGSRELIAGRLSARVHEYMPAGLLDSQFAALEAPDPAEQAVEVPIGPPPEVIAEEIARRLAS